MRILLSLREVGAYTSHQQSSPGTLEAISGHDSLSGISSSGGTTDPEPGTYTHSEGENFTIEAIPDHGSYFIRWRGDVPDEKKYDRIVNLTMSQDKNDNIMRSQKDERTADLAKERARRVRSFFTSLILSQREKYAFPLVWKS